MRANRRDFESTATNQDLFGPRDFNVAPIVPFGIKVVAHVPPQKRTSWDQHGVIGYYVGPAYEHYRCYRIWVPATKAFRISDCLKLFPADIMLANMGAKLATLSLLPSPQWSSEGGNTAKGKEAETEGGSQIGCTPCCRPQSH